MTFGPILRSRYLFPFAALTFATSAGAAPANSAFDGLWSVEIVAENVDCRARTVALEVEEGQISIVGFGARASGEVASDGDLEITISHSDKVVNASGSLSGTVGSGSWVSPDCAGTWVARRS